jgi:hypothetical protein
VPLEGVPDEDRGLIRAMNQDDGIKRVATDQAAQEMREKSFERANWFNWERTANQTIDGLTEAASN